MLSTGRPSTLRAAAPERGLASTLALWRKAVLAVVTGSQLATPTVALWALSKTVYQASAVVVAGIPISAMADAIVDTARQGQTLGQGLVTSAQRPQFDASTGTFRLPDGRGGWIAIPQAQLFPQSSAVTAAGGSDASRAQTNYGNHTGFAAVTAEAELRLLSEGSLQGNAYQTIRRSALDNRAPNLRNDPIFTRSDALLSGPNPQIGSLLQACTTSSTVSMTTTPRRIPDYETCDRTQKLTSCNVRRVITGVSEVAACSTGALTHDLIIHRNALDKITSKVYCTPSARTTHQQPVIIDAYGQRGQNHGGPMTVTVNTSVAVTDVPLATLWPHWYGGFRRLDVTYSVPTACTPEDATCTFTLRFALAAFTDSYAPSSTPATLVSAPATSCPAGQNFFSNACYAACSTGTFVAGQCKSCPLDPASGKTGTYNPSTDRCEYSVPAGEQWVQLFEIERFRREVAQSLIDTPPGCATSTFCSAQPTAWTPGSSLADQASTNAWQCIDASNSRTFFGFNLTPATWGTRLGPLFPGAPASPPAPICYEANARNYRCNFNLGPIPCYTDVNGQQRCPYSKEVTDPATGQVSIHWCEIVDGVEQCSPERASTCDALQARPECTFVKSECAEGARDPATGVCMAYTDTYDCGTTVPVETVTHDSSSVSCPGPIRCMGTECRTLTPETNSDFGRASVALTTLQFAQMDSNCSSGVCEIFKGEAMECKVAVGGLIDCCEKPRNVGVGDYIKLALATWELTKDSALMAQLWNSSASIRGAWQGLSNGTTSAISDVLKPIMTPLEALVSKLPGLAGADGSVVQLALEGIPGTGLSALTNLMMDATMRFVAETFGPSVASSLFSVTPGGVVLNTMPGSLGSILSTLMTIYTVIMVAIIILQIIYRCEKKELELGVKRAMHACHHVGSYCRGPLCIEKVNSYCCFASPLSRIINEQARPQIGRGWGTPRLPNCSGLSAAEMASLDWSRINLDEWIALLKIAGLTPTEINDMLWRYGLDITARNVPPGTKTSPNAAQITTHVLGNNGNPNAGEQARDRRRASAPP